MHRSIKSNDYGPGNMSQLKMKQSFDQAIIDEEKRSLSALALFISKSPRDECSE